MTVDTTKITVRKALYDNISQIHKDHFNIQSNCYHSEHSSQYVHSVKRMHGVLVFYSLHIKHKKIQVKNLNRDISRLQGRLLEMCFPSHSYQYSTPVGTSELKLIPCFVLTVLGSILYSSTQEKTQQPNTILGLPWLFCFSRVSSDMSRFHWGIITNVYRSADDSFTQKTANQHTSSPS